MKAYELLSDRSKWTQGAYAITKDSVPCSVYSKEAEKFCIIGAITKCYREDYSTVTMKDMRLSMSIVRRIELYLRDVKKTGCFVTWYNDTHTYEEVVAILKELDI